MEQEQDLVDVLSNPGRISNWVESLGVDLGRYEYVQNDITGIYFEIASVDWDALEDVQDEIYGVK